MYQVIECNFPGLRAVITQNLTYGEAKSLCDYYNSECDSYTSYEVEEMPLTLKDIRNKKLNKLNKLK